MTPTPFVGLGLARCQTLGPSGQLAEKAQRQVRNFVRHDTRKRIC
jgi:hypothetical protein